MLLNFTTQGCHPPRGTDAVLDVLAPGHGTMSQALLPSFRRQQLLLEFAALKKHCPEGIYLAPSTSNAPTWSGVLFVRSGPYASAIVRFEIVFPLAYPEVAPQIICSTELFHPLLTPLTTYTSTGADLDPAATTNIPTTNPRTPGEFSLKHGFSGWFVQPSDSKAGSSADVRDCDQDDVAIIPHQSGRNRARHNSSVNTLNIHSVLAYFKRAFEDDEFLDALPYAAATNTNAWYAWRTHRGLPGVGAESVNGASMEPSKAASSIGKHPADWNWDGVWQSRVESGLDESIDDASLYSSQANRTATVPDGIRFVKLDDVKVGEIQCSMLRAFGIEPADLDLLAS